ncbi:MAG: prepilin peptidase [Marmoricola sp.]
MIPVALSATLIGVLGLAIGSFLNVVIHRVPAGESIVRPASRCPECGHEIRNRHNVPVIGWLILKGRCYDCRAPISLRYPLVEAGTAALFVGTVLRFSDEPRLWPAYLYLAAIGIALALIDLDVHRLPDVIVLPSYIVGAALLLIDWNPHALLRAVEGGAILFAFYYAIAVIAKGAMGFGDVKLAGLLGGAMAYWSWGTLLTGAFLAFIIGSVVGVLLISLGKAGRKTAIPFGPFMILGALAALLGAGGLGDAYLRHFTG